MSNEKKYYWLRLCKGFFESLQIKFLRAQTDGDRMTVIYLRLLLEGINADGAVQYNNIFPSCIEEVAFNLNEPQETVQRTVEMLKKLKLIEIQEDGSLYLPELKNLIGSETAAAARTRKHRAKDETLSELITSGGNPFDEYV